MKKLLAVLCIALLLAACGGGTHEPVQPQPSGDPGTVAPVTPPSSGETPGKPETDQPPTGSNVKTETTDYRYGMEGYEDMQIAFSMHPTSLQELFAVADEGRLMPPKSTWFEPKLQSGLFVHRI